MKTWVIKIGTSLLRGSKERPTSKAIDGLCKSIANAQKKGDQLVLVSSGAVGLGCIQLSLKDRPKDLISLQATAAVGQVHLMSLYQKALENLDIKIAQVLITRTDLESRSSYTNASNTLKQLIKWKIIPIINENDTISQEELLYGDNDTLSSLVALAVGANDLILLTDVDRLYSANPRLNKDAIPIKDIHHPSEINIFSTDDSGNSEWGTGGIKTKLAAAQIATNSGIKVHLADGRNPKTLEEILNGSRGGTVFHPNPTPLESRKSWLAHALRPVADIQLDDGACYALKHSGASLLLVGITKVKGEFEKNQAVKLTNKEGKELARGISSLSSNQILNGISSKMNGERSPVVIHRDVLVLTEMPAKPD